MALIEFYPQLRQVHVGLATASVTLFVARGLGVLAGAAWPMGAAPRVLSVLIDTLLLSAGGTLWWLLGLRPDRDHWLAVKLVLIVGYIVIGSFALKRAPTRGGKGLAFAASLACIAAVVAIALSRDPAAPLRWITPG